MTGLLGLVYKDAFSFHLNNLTGGPPRPGTKETRMRLRTSWIIAVMISLLAVSAFAAPTNRCNTRLPSADTMAAIQQAINNATTTTGRVTIPVWFHIIQGGKSARQGAVSDEAIAAQMDVLNDSYLGLTGGANSDFAFELAGVTRTINKNWFENFALDFAVEAEAKRALKKGGSDTLNIYTLDGVFWLGWAYLPDVAVKDKYSYIDGVVVDWRTLPGGGIDPYSDGDTATHEVGHWLSLLHTFDRGCSLLNDEVKDTPAVAEPNFVCLPGIDSCTGSRFPGTDAVENFMDYTEDFCMYAFTPGQVERMQKAWHALRAK